jgi:hypothetical protein
MNVTSMCPKGSQVGPCRWITVNRHWAPTSTNPLITQCCVQIILNIVCKLYGGNVLAKHAWLVYFPSHSTGVNFSVKGTHIFSISNSPASFYLQPLSVFKNYCVTPCICVQYCNIKLYITSLGAGFLLITVLRLAMGLTERISVKYQDPFCGLNWLEHEPDYSPPSAL